MLVRQHIPKGADFDNFDDKIMEIQKKINAIPRAKWNFQTPLQVFCKLIR